MKTKTSSLIISVLVLFNLGFSYNILVWDHDPDREDRFEDPYINQLMDDEYNLIKTLIELGEKPEVVEELPKDLSLYDLVFVCIGWTVC